MFIPGVDRTGGFYGRYSGRQAELKFFDVEVNDSTIATGGIIFDSVNNIPQGVSENERVGRKCTIKSINWHGNIFLGTYDAEPGPRFGDRLRVILYQDKQANGDLAKILDILETDDYLSFRNLSNSGRFNILMDKFMPMNYLTYANGSGAQHSGSGVTKNLAFYKACNIPIEFSGPTGATSEVRSNNIGVLLVSELGMVGIASTIRLRFSDK